MAATKHALAALLAADLSTLDLVAFMVDGIRVAEHTLRSRARDHPERHQGPLPLSQGATENTTVVCELLAGPRDRGLE